jgi:hypothetical protein
MSTQTMNRAQRRMAKRDAKRAEYRKKSMPPNATSHRGAACGASGGLPGCTSAAATEDK